MTATATLAGRPVPTATAQTWVSRDRFIDTVAALNVAQAAVEHLLKRCAVLEREATEADALSRELFGQLTASENEIDVLKHTLDRVKFNRLHGPRRRRPHPRPARRPRPAGRALPF